MDESSKTAVADRPFYVIVDTAIIRKKNAVATRRLDLLLARAIG